jgi:hypothetical protein
MSRVVARLIVVTLALGLTGSRIAAHPGAASDIVIARGSGGTLDVLLTTDPDALLLKLDAMQETEARPDLPASAAASTIARISAHRRALVSSIAVRVADRRVDLAWVGVETPPTAEDQRRGKIVVRMRAALPHDEASVTVQTSLILGSYPLIVRRAAEPDVVIWLQGAEVSPAISLVRPAAESTIDVAMSGVVLGFSHVVPKGLDHVLFVLGLFLLAPGIRGLLAQVSVFTIAHTVTLAATTLGVLAPPASLVEPLIALSIVFVALENLRRTSRSRWRLGLVFLFGLLHGVGFAGVLTTMNLPRASLITTLISFNVGVELAQITVLVAAAAIVRRSSLEPPVYRRFVVRPASLAIAAVGVVWVIERVWLNAAG